MATAELEIIKPVGKVYQDVVRAEAAHISTGDESKGPIEESISLGLFVYSRLSNLRTEFCEARKGMPKSDEPKAEKIAEEISEAYRNWLGASRELMTRLLTIKKFDSAFVGSLKGFTEFEVAFKDVSLMSLDTERVKRSIASLRATQGMTFEQAMEELRANLR